MQRTTNARLSPQTSQVQSFAPHFAERREALVAALDALKAEDIVVIDLTQKAAFADLMIIASGNSTRHVASLADTAINTLAKLGHRPMGVEGNRRGTASQTSDGWVCVDAGDIVIHLFTPSSREHYRLEKLWSFPSGI
ncbi:MAG TPA: ribosome silencing factor [Alphaproteobacteria bacterium]|nr:ribosome silencing factor [Alphaproteobacteria bacterium]